MPSPVVLLASVALALGASGALAAAARQRRRLARMESTPTTRVADVTEGLVEVQGTLRTAAEPLTSPLTSRRCAWFRFQVSEQRARGTLGRHGRPTFENAWQTRVDDRQCIPCTIDDDTGKLEVDLHGAEVFVDARVHAHSGPWHDAPEELERILSMRYGVATRGLVFNRSLHYAETVLVEGTRVYALGTAVRQPGGALRLQKGAEVFIVSDRSEGDLARRFRRDQRLAVAVGVLLAVLAVALPWLPFEPFAAP